MVVNSFFAFFSPCRLRLVFCLWKSETSNPAAAFDREKEGGNLFPFLGCIFLFQSTFRRGFGNAKKDGKKGKKIPLLPRVRRSRFLAFSPPPPFSCLWGHVPVLTSSAAEKEERIFPGSIVHACVYTKKSRPLKEEEEGEEMPLE